MLKTGQAVQHGISTYMLQVMVERGVVDRIGRGLYRLTDMPPLSEPDFIAVTAKMPGGVICLISALSFHGLTTQIPHQVMVALPRRLRGVQPKTPYPPIRVFWFGERAFEAGVETHEIDRHSVRIYSREKTIADCFKYRNKIGFDVALEALRMYTAGRSTKVDALVEFARVCRVENVMRPYLESLL